jgi:hypothetical protein
MVFSDSDSEKHGPKEIKQDLKIKNSKTIVPKLKNKI